MILFLICWWKVFVQRKSHRAMATEIYQSHSWNEVENVVELFAKHTSDVPKAKPFLLTLLLPPTTLFLLLILSCSLLRWIFYFKNSLMCTLVCSFSDNGIDRSRVWKQCSHQFWRRSQFPEVPTHFLRPQSVVPSHRRGLGPGIQSRPEG